MPDKKMSSKWYRSWWVAFIIFTIVYLVVIGYLGSISSFEISRCPKSTWSAITSGCLTMNELGDFLAGAFAPGAFMLLAATVFMQSRELEKQSKDIRQTRDIMKAQLGFVEQQTAFLKQEQEFRKDAELNRIIGASIGRLVARLQSQPNSLCFRLDRHPTPYGVPELLQRIEEKDDAVEKARVVSQQLNRSIVRLTELRRQGNTEKSKPADPDGLRLVFRDCWITFNMSKDAPPEASWLVETIELEQMINSIKAFAADAGFQLFDENGTDT